MATLVLTAVGTLVGGPIGGAIGSLLGSTIDRGLFSPKAAQGARLDSLAVQGSSYGADLPRLFGTMRVSGSVIWSTDLQEHRGTSGGGKGSAKTTTYSYSASFAVALSARRVIAVRRIWADGTLLRGAAGDWKGEVGAFRLHPGDETQAVDPLIAAAQGIGRTPAHRGLAYAVFEDLPLGDYGNRIPSLSFELVADEGAVSLATIAAELSDGAIGGTGGPRLGGYAAAGDSVRGAIEGLAAALPVRFADGADGLRLVDEGAAPVAIEAGDLGSSADGKAPPRLLLEQQAAGTLNEAIAIGYDDPARDYQRGSQSARREGVARRTGSLDLAAAVDAATARGFAEARLAREWAGRLSATVTLSWRRLDLAAGAMVTLPGEAGVWRVTDRNLEGMVVTLGAQRIDAGGPVPPPPADAGSGVLQPDAPAGETVVVALDLPALGDDPATAPVLLVAAAGTAPGWRRAVLSVSLDDGASWQPMGKTATPAIIGTTIDALPPGSARLRDTVNGIEVALLHDAMTLAGSDATGWSATANLALIGDELVQFAIAEQTGPGRFRLGGLLRGRRGSEWAMAGHAPGERFVLIDADALTAWAPPTSAIGGTIRVSASGVGDVAPAEAAIAFQARALRPPVPVALRGALSQGALALGWTRRSRQGWTWLDGIDAPLAEEAERYRVTVTRGAATLAVETGLPAATIDLAALGGGTGGIAWTVAQIGTFAGSLPPAASIITDGDRG